MGTASRAKSASVNCFRRIVLRNGGLHREPQPPAHPPKAIPFICKTLVYTSSGYLAKWIGGTRLFLIGIFVTSILTLLTPLAATHGVASLVAIRVAVGLCEGVTYPSMHAVWFKWAPRLERSRLASIAFAGSYFGTVVAMVTSGSLAHFHGWESVFYVFGAVGLLWCMPWLSVVNENPRDDPTVTEDELRLCRSEEGNQVNKIPWREIWTSAPVWAIIVAHFCENWGFYTMLTELPAFMEDEFGLNLAHSGLMASLPYLAMGVVVVTVGQIADAIRQRELLSTTLVSTCGGFIIRALFVLMFIWSFSNFHSIAASMTLLSIAFGLGGMSWIGFGVNHLDLAPAHASLLMGISNTFATLPGILSPHITGEIVKHKMDTEWEIIFYLVSGVYVAGAVFYFIFSSGEKQPWADQGAGPRPEGTLLEDDQTTDGEEAVGLKESPPGEGAYGSNRGYVH
ncbi:unnamed protein product [Cyprideis torosa]|uniref:Uncharacterized protein n=1 Tax=Cyprideis torosa TaxID=163714 RepID=A0A7R8W4Q1_9CRUS|nr:unnamed protein product [Cyprideis torosa]CAG0879058.1 unnamed protein product [Cyprideis torosa]